MRFSAFLFFFFSSRRRHTRSLCDWSSDVCSSDLAMEPHAIVAAWDGDALSIDTPSQGLAMAQGRIAGLFGIPPEKIHIRSPFLGRSEERRVGKECRSRWSPYH